MLAATVVAMPALVAESGTVDEVHGVDERRHVRGHLRQRLAGRDNAVQVEYLVTQVDELDPVVIRGRSHQGKEHTRRGAPGGRSGRRKRHRAGCLAGVDVAERSPRNRLVLRPDGRHAAVDGQVEVQRHAGQRKVRQVAVGEQMAELIVGVNEHQHNEVRLVAPSPAHREARRAGLGHRGEAAAAVEPAQIHRAMRLQFGNRFCRHQGLIKTVMSLPG
jgi:hypothetical protein